MILVGPSLGAAVAIDFAVSHPEAVSALSFFILELCSIDSFGKKLQLMHRTGLLASAVFHESLKISAYVFRSKGWCWLMQVCIQKAREI